MSSYGGYGEYEGDGAERTGERRRRGSTGSSRKRGEGSGRRDRTNGERKKSAHKHKSSGSNASSRRHKSSSSSARRAARSSSARDNSQQDYYDEQGQAERRANQLREPPVEREENIFTRSIPAPPLASLEDERRKLQEMGYDLSKQPNFDMEQDELSGCTTEERSVATSLHRSLKAGNWQQMYDTLLQLREEATTQSILTVLATDEDKNTILHTTVWKAPAALTKFLIEMVDKAGLARLCMKRDADGNTPLHLYCANLHEALQKIHLTILRTLVEADSRALQVQNAQGDIPLHLLVGSPACTQARDELTASRAQQAVTIMLFRAPATAVIQDTVEGATPLHAALSLGALEGVLLALMQDRGKVASKVEDDRGFLPLHYVAAFLNNTRRPISALVVEQLVDAFPEAICYKSSNGDTPLHLYISNISEESKEDEHLTRNTQRVLEHLMGDEDAVEAGEQASPVMMVNNEKLTPLHCCAVFDAPPQVTQLIMTSPLSITASAMPNMFGATGLHLACAQQSVSHDISNVVALGTPEAATVEDRLKRTPLHVAAQNLHATDQLIKTLVDLNPDATAVRTQRGHLPLHLAAQSKAKESVIRALIKAYPKATEARNKSSNTPLHDAAKYRASLGVVKLLLEAYPDAVYIQNQYGNLPLHCATAYQAPSEVVKVLLEAWPDGAAIQNRNQDAPLHYAAAYTTTAAAVKPLIDAAPAAVLLLNQSGQSPIDRAKMNNAPEEIVELLEESADEWTRKAARGDGWGAFSADFDDGF